MLLIDLILNQITGQTGANETKEAKIMVPLKYLRNFLRILEMSFFFNCEINVIFTWSANCVIVYTDAYSLFSSNYVINIR